MTRMNKHVINTWEQINNTLNTLTMTGLSRISKNILHYEEGNIATLTWEKHVPGRHNAGESFTTLNQYVSIYETGAYHCILFDGSIVRVFFQFDKNILIQESLLYWPAPIMIPEEDIDELGIREAMNLHLSGLNTDSKALKMRTPFRVDFDPSSASAVHPETHIHMQHNKCRISVKKPICFNTFIKFIFSNFYPDLELAVIEELEPLHYSGYNVLEKAVVSL